MKAAPINPSQKVVPEKKPQKKAGMNDTETRFQREILVPAKAAGTVVSWKYEAVVLSLDAKTTYRPDFLVALPSGRLEFYEVKNRQIWEDSTVKFKWARKEYPEFRFYMVQFIKNRGWRIKHAEPGIVCQVLSQILATTAPATKGVRKPH